MKKEFLPIIIKKQKTPIKWKFCEKRIFFLNTSKNQNISEFYNYKIALERKENKNENI